MTMLGRKIANAALEYLGTPHVNQAKVKGKGVDCGMLLIAALEGAGAVPKDSIVIPPYSNEWHLHHSTEWFLKYVSTYCERVEELQEGDFILYQFGRCASHGAVYVGNNVVCHALVNQGCVLTDLHDVMFLDATGKSRVRGYFRFVGGSKDGSVQN